MASHPQPPYKEITTEFPQDILFFHILPRLPGRSVLRFKSVSKQWHSYLSSPLFKKMHLLCIPNDEHESPHRLLILSVTKICKFSTIDCEAPEDGLTPSRNLPFQVNFENMKVLATFHGLVGIGVTMDYFNHSNLILWNPLTSEYKKLPKTNWGNGLFRTYDSTFSLYYNSSDDDYKLLCVSSCSSARDICLYSLTSDSWIKINSGFKLDKPGNQEYWRPSPWLNGNFYFLREGYIYYNRPPLCSIIKLNTKTEKITEMLTPMFRGSETRFSCFTVLRGRLHIYVTENDYWKSQQKEWEPKVEVWRMDEDEKWAKVLTYVMKKTCILYQPKPVHVMRNGNWLMYYSKTKTETDYFYKVDMEKHTTDNLSSSIDGRFNIDTGKYTETFVSLNRHIK